MLQLVKQRLLRVISLSGVTMTNCVASWKGIFLKINQSRDHRFPIEGLPAFLLLCGGGGGGGGEGDRFRLTPFSSLSCRSDDMKNPSFTEFISGPVSRDEFPRLGGNPSSCNTTSVNTALDYLGNISHNGHL